jgi:anti-sigma factor RsiW
MPDATSRDPHVRLSLGRYLLGAADPDERDAIERHLAICPQCLAEADELSTAAAALTQLSDRDRQEIVADYLARQREPELAITIRRPPRSRRPRLLLSAGGLALIVIAIAGVAIGVLAGNGTGGEATAQAATATASAADQATGATLAVRVTNHTSAVTVQATVANLRAGEAYRLYAVDKAGQLSLVAAWLGAPEAHEIRATVPLRPDELSFFTVTTVTGSAVVSAYLNPGASPPR